MSTGGLHTFAILSLALAGLCAVVVLFDILGGRRQHMPIMNVVWVVTMLYAGPIGLWAYFRFGRLSTHQAMMAAEKRGEKPPAKTKPFWQSVAVGATHCGSGCTLGDLLAESFLIFVPLKLFGEPIFAAWALDYGLALLIGVAFQYFTIKPMRGLSPARGLKAAIKADFLSLTAWQAGMYGWMAIVTFLVFGRELEKTGAVFWFEMQIAMLCGLLTSLPVNAWLLRSGIKETM